MSTVPVPVVWTVPVTWSLASLYHVNFILGFLSVCAEGGGGGGGGFPSAKVGYRKLALQGWNKGTPGPTSFHFSLFLS